MNELESQPAEILESVAVNLQGIFCIFLSIFVAACTAGGNSTASNTHQAVQQNSQADDFIGFVNMEADGTIILRLNAYADGGKTVGHGYFRYPPGNSEYEEVLRHVGPIKPGEGKPVRPWP